MSVSSPARSTDDPDDDVLTLPWWFSWWRVAILAAGAMLAVVGTIGLVVKAQQPDTDSPDAGFLRDMRDHHDQAIFMSLTYVDNPDVDPTLKTMATEIVVGQSFQTGQMVELLRAMNAEEENSSGIAMTWMGMNVPTDEMPGMASPDELDALAAAEGPAADALFVELMNAHHQGGIHMASDAAGRVKSDRVSDMATRMAKNQQVEIAELTAALATSQAG